MKEKFFKQVIRFRIPIILVFFIAALWGAWARGNVAVNYDMNDYLPDDSPSTLALEKMNDTFDSEIPNARIAIKDVSYKEACEYKNRLESITGVQSVTWLDDVNYLDMPIDMLDSETVDSYYKDRIALYTVTISEDYINDAVPAIRELIGEGNAMTGSAVSTAVATSSTVKEIRMISVLAVLIVLLVLTLTTTSYLEPLLVLLGIGVAVLINAGTNLLFGEISFVTNAAGSILQLAVSLDYSVFLIHRFHDCKKDYSDAKEAINSALCMSLSSILSSGLTTVIGFLALLFMRFQIGPDLGRALAKGIAISLITVFIFMPGIILLCSSWMDRLQHKPFLPSFMKAGNFVQKITRPLAIIFLLIMIPALILSNRNQYYYGSSHIFSSGTQYGDDTKLIENTFGIKDTYVLMVPSDTQKEQRAFIKELEKNNNIISVTSLTSILGPAIPRSFIPNSLADKLSQDGYDRMLLSVGVDYEGDETFQLVENIRDLSTQYFGSDFYLAGQGVSTYDLMDTITSDMVKVNFVAIAAVFLILLITMKSLKKPLILVLTIETAIWINLTIPMLQHRPLFYIAYLIISSIQLGATVDYAILFSDRFEENCSMPGVQNAIAATISQTTPSILTSGVSLITVGFLLGYLSTHGLLAQLGLLLGTGTICSLISVLFVLPGLLQFSYCHFSFP